MSYKQIFRRATRLFTTQAWSVVDAILGKDEQELKDFDAELRKERQHREAGPTASESRGEERKSRERKSPPPRGRRKPGEQSDEHYFAVLGLTPDTPPRAIHQRYKKLMSTYHPDRTVHLPEDERIRMTKKASEISEAYAILQRRLGFK